MEWFPLFSTGLCSHKKGREAQPIIDPTFWIFLSLFPPLFFTAAPLWSSALKEKGAAPCWPPQLQPLPLRQPQWTRPGTGNLPGCIGFIQPQTSGERPYLNLGTTENSCVQICVEYLLFGEAVRSRLLRETDFNKDLKCVNSHVQFPSTISTFNYISKSLGRKYFLIQ